MAHKKEEKPERFNNEFDHTKDDLFQAVGIREDQLDAAYRMVNKTCCGMDKSSEAIEHWCDVLNKKEMAMLIKRFKHEVVEKELKSNLKSFRSGRADFFDMIFGGGGTAADNEKPNKDNAIYDHDSYTSDATGIKEKDLEKVVENINSIIPTLLNKRASHFIEAIQKNTTHKQLAMLYASKVLETNFSPDNAISELLKFLRKE